MSVQRALQAYTQERHNCAQSIFRGFQEVRAVPEETIVLAKALGGGWAPGGRCGALHAALELTADPAAKERLTQTFVEKAGAETCREIKKHRKLACVECVQLAAEALVSVSES